MYAPQPRIKPKYINQTRNLLVYGKIFQLTEQPARASISLKICFRTTSQEEKDFMSIFHGEISFVFKIKYSTYEKYTWRG